MATFKNCPACELPVLSKADKCPHCGHPFRHSKNAMQILGTVLSWITSLFFARVAWRVFLANAIPAGLIASSLALLFLPPLWNRFNVPFKVRGLVSLCLFVGLLLIIPPPKEPQTPPQSQNPSPAETQEKLEPVPEPPSAETQKKPQPTPNPIPISNALTLQQKQAIWNDLHDAWAAENVQEAKDALLTKHRITRDQLEAVMMEALTNDWQVPKVTEKAPSPKTPGGDRAGRPLPFEIVQQERIKKGVIYVLFDVNAVLKTVSPQLTEESVRATFHALLVKIRDDARRHREQIDGVSATLYLSQDHFAGGSGVLGYAEWWPKGHSFSPDNAANIENKATYIEKIVVFSPLPMQAESVVTRLPESKRREIFMALVRSEDRATLEAEAKYPTDGSKIPFNKLRTYDFKGALEKKWQEFERLRDKYEQELLEQYGITQEELDKIRTEAMIEQWPFPPID